MAPDVDPPVMPPPAPGEVVVVPPPAPVLPPEPSRLQAVRASAAVSAQAREVNWVRFMAFPQRLCIAASRGSTAAPANASRYGGQGASTVPSDRSFRKGRFMT